MERYRIRSHQSSRYDLVPFEAVCTLEYGASLPKKTRVDGPYPVMGSNGVSGFHNKYLIEGPSIIVGRKGSAGEVTYVEKNCFPIDTTYYVKLTDTSRTNLVFVYLMLKGLNMSGLRDGAGVPGLNRKDVYSRYRLPLPPLPVQKEIVAEIEGYQKVIDGARAVVDNYRPHISVGLDWPTVALGDVCERLQYGLSTPHQHMWNSGYKTFRMNELAEGRSVDGG